MYGEKNCRNNVANKTIEMIIMKKSLSNCLVVHYSTKFVLLRQTAVVLRRVKTPKCLTKNNGLLRRSFSYY